MNAGNFINTMIFSFNAFFYLANLVLALSSCCNPLSGKK